MQQNKGLCHVSMCKNYLKKHFLTWHNPLSFSNSSTQAIEVDNLGRSESPMLYISNKISYSRFLKKILRYVELPHNVTFFGEIILHCGVT